MKIETKLIDYNNPKEADDLLFILESYMLDPMGGSKPMSEETKSNLIPEFLKLPFVFSLILYVDNKPAAVANCFDSFSTFKCKPVINIHDFAVHHDFRGKGLSIILLEEIEKIAAEKGCCKITLEVLEGNKVAQNVYKKFGFNGYELNSETGRALFWEKKLNL